MDIFCKIINGEIPSKTIYEDDIVKVILDVNPKSCGHMLIIPKKHYLDIFDIDDDVLNHVMVIARKIGNLLKERLNCDGITYEENNGIPQLVKHFHLHIIPVYKESNDLSIDEIYKILK